MTQFDVKSLNTKARIFSLKLEALPIDSPLEIAEGYRDIDCYY
jgi:hypothetical protein